MRHKLTEPVDEWNGWAERWDKTLVRAVPLSLRGELPRPTEPISPEAQRFLDLLLEEVRYVGCPVAARHLGRLETVRAVREFAEEFQAWRVRTGLKLMSATAEPYQRSSFAKTSHISCPLWTSAPLAVRDDGTETTLTRGALAAVRTRPLDTNTWVDLVNVLAEQGDPRAVALGRLLDLQSNRFNAGTLLDADRYYPPESRIGDAAVAWSTSPAAVAGVRVRGSGYAMGWANFVAGGARVRGFVSGGVGYKNPRIGDWRFGSYETLDPKSRSRMVSDVRDAFKNTEGFAWVVLTLPEKRHPSRTVGVIEDTALRTADRAAQWPAVVVIRAFDPCPGSRPAERLEANVVNRGRQMEKALRVHAPDIRVLVETWRERVRTNNLKVPELKESYE